MWKRKLKSIIYLLRIRLSLVIRWIAGIIQPTIYTDNVPYLIQDLRPGNDYMDYIIVFNGIKYSINDILVFITAKYLDRKIKTFKTQKYAAKPHAPTDSNTIAGLSYYNNLSLDITKHNLDEIFDTASNNPKNVQYIFNFLVLASPFTIQDYLSIWVDIKAGNIEIGKFTEGELLVGLLRYLNIRPINTKPGLNNKPRPQ